MVDRLPRLKILDMIEVSEDDRAKAELFFSEQYQQQLQQMQPQIIFNTSSNYTQQTAQLLTNLNQSQVDSQYIGSPRLKPILFMDKIYANNLLGSTAIPNTNTNLTVNMNSFQNNANNKINKTKPPNINNINYEKLAREMQPKHKNQF